MRIDELEDGKKEEKKAKKLFRLPYKANSLLRQSNKKPDTVFIQYLTQKGVIEFRNEKIVSGNIVVIRNKVHKLNPRKQWRQGKNMWYIIREIDRNPVSNDDYEDVKARGQDTDADVPLIKAVLAAQQKPSVMGNKNLIWIILGIVAVGLFLMWRFMK